MRGEREPGFYWVRLKNDKHWRIGEYVSGVWSVPFRPGLFEDAELAEIDSERVLRGVTRLYPRDDEKITSTGVGESPRARVKPPT